MARRKSPPATKRDLALNRQEVKREFAAVRKDIATKEDFTYLMDQIGKLYVANEKWKDEIIHEFKIVAEDMRHDYLGAHKDRIENHENCIIRLKRHTHLMAA